MSLFTRFSLSSTLYTVFFLLFLVQTCLATPRVMIGADAVHSEPSRIRPRQTTFTSFSFPSS
ncbi:hypothetical protein EJ05DRAFT_472093 [Pseudovirgaria hyperparasitica]|uniref:Uncharacterized protein n=1 Tax=Pseudovirgaria hyperparasitica TaxID=470096 RepID=A0A6A6WLU3_9PEZI|nr:uncharacterized protein EJ05DRAFT_472093 [Pseudovirgaria hyperparasitica]KAF2763174.1 hypothetical protein EJ05DRAFT_472093 [Pseudovirgaria hyperparasitica]